MSFFKIDFVFTQTGLLKYISHLDLMRLFTRAMRRAELPLKLTEGFSPHPKFSIKKALKLGVESGHEEAVAGLNQLIRPEDFKSRLQEQLPEGILIKEAILS
ncbi:MAG: TIGR03936 family radical SAM-associated protein [Candidatus Omnitrophica bacterium]|nr:TIGR03936 family radical SAM-associated protein [Candidatus Omnitrophota bacterium]